MVLTKEQKRLVEDNHNLIYYYCRKNDISIDTYYDVCAIGLCKAAATYDKEQSTFATYALYVINNEVKGIYRKNASRGKQDVQVFSYDKILTNNYGDECTLLDFIITEGKDAYESPILTDFNKIWNQRERRIALLLYEGYTQTEISKIIGVKQPQTSRIIKIMRRKVDKERW